MTDGRFYAVTINASVFCNYFALSYEGTVDLNEWNFGTVGGNAPTLQSRFPAVNATAIEADPTLNVELTFDQNVKIGVSSCLMVAGYRDS